MEYKKAKKCKNKAAIPELPDQVIVEILSKTTSKALGRCNCVSKQWRYSFTTEAFKRRLSYSSGSINVDGMIIAIFPPSTSNLNSTLNGFKLLKFEIPSKFNKNENNGSIVQGKLKMLLPSNLSQFDKCSNIYDGLACVFNQCVDSYSDLSIVLYSIRTNDVVVLPMSTNYDNLSNLARLQKFCFIGFDTLRKEYKIVRMVRCYDLYYDLSDRKSSTTYETLVLGSRSWNRIDGAKVPLSLSRGCASWYGHGICLEGVVFWIHYNATHGSGTYRYTVAAFDLSHDEFYVFDFDKILLESSFNTVPDMCYIAALRGCPTVFALQKKDDHDEVLVCTFSDVKMTTVAWTRTVSTWSFMPYASVSESRFIIRHAGLKTNTGVHLLCKDLDKDFNWEIQVKY
ncbi:hypothetical protein RND81_06G046700 [Saponaria officinalis]|uniref:F-box domain-containing protein n=1 Tax=Saponaria officinalis TaxID=3572 RepID=A0AAW1K775_SAPOF